ncbi:MAG: sigma-54-dependent Fis family transcriptional regulator, partial [bacterium]|nr:sigma-54-dependent Fis family transcriptional regulator [bacterium]
MIEIIKEKIWNLLKEKEVSLAMIYNSSGEILWSRGREIFGRSIKKGRGFSKTYIKKTLLHGAIIETDDVLIDLSHEGLPNSFVALRVKSLVICPINRDIFLYVDSGKKRVFTPEDRLVFRVLGELLGEIIDQIKKSQEDVGGITGSCEVMSNLKQMILKFSLEIEPVLLMGETGAGKSHIAGLIHKYSGRNGRFVTVDSPTIHENLFESVLFGHKKGAFTDAKYDKKGLVAEADGGTLFIDEISEVPLSFQAKLLRFIETKKYLVLGESSERCANIRIIAATNRDLHHAIEAKEFREDLYFRLHILELKIPPLRVRKEDLKKLVLEYSRFLKGKEIGTGFWEAIIRHNWPGNVRELI